MERTIDGTRFNISIDIEIAHWGDALARADPRHVYQTLYRTRDGAWYMRTRRGHEDDIAPLSAEAAAAWAEQKHLTFVLASHFSERVRPTRVTVL